MNLTFSIIYDSSFLKANQQYYLSMAVAVGIQQALRSILNLESISIKRPNDIMVSHQKIGGILIENTILGNYLKHSIIGIGINVLQTQFKEEISATSLRLIRR